MLNSLDTSQVVRGGTNAVIVVTTINMSLKMTYMTYPIAFGVGL